MCACVLGAYGRKGVRTCAHVCLHSQGAYAPACLDGRRPHMPGSGIQAVHVYKLRMALDCPFGQVRARDRVGVKLVRGTA